jgi:hypothetical protein
MIKAYIRKKNSRKKKLKEIALENKKLPKRYPEKYMYVFI